MIPLAGKMRERNIAVLLSVSFRSPLELILVFIRCVGRIFDLGILAGKGGGTAIGLEELGRRFIASNLHYP